MQLHEKEVMRQQHEEMLNEHREMVDSLTAEILLVRESNTTMQVPTPSCSLSARMICQNTDLCCRYGLRCIVSCSRDLKINRKKMTKLNEEPENYNSGYEVGGRNVWKVIILSSFMMLDFKTRENANYIKLSFTLSI